MDTWDKLKTECARCGKCELGRTRTNLVFGVGNESAAVMFIGEGPGEQEDLKGEPFVGPAGQLLDTMLEIIDLDRTKVYIANIVKCRPPRNRDPLPIEQEACIGWLNRQIAGFSHHQGARPVVSGKRPPRHGAIPSLRAAARPLQAAGDLCGSQAFTTGD